MRITIFAVTEQSTTPVGDWEERSPRRAAGGGINPARRLLFGKLRHSHVGQKAGMGSTTMYEMVACFGQTQIAIDRQMHFRGIFVFLAIVFPPANRAKSQRGRSVQGFISTTRAAKTVRQVYPPREWTRFVHSWFTSGEPVGHELATREAQIALL
jgi:hypothetical protein